MEHLKKIGKYIKTLTSSDDLHLLVLQGPAGCGKTEETAVQLGRQGVKFLPLGSFSTPLALYNALCRNPGIVHVIDDTAGIFASDESMAILNSATWGGRDGKRIVKWNSTTSKADTPEFEFRGKVIVLTNSVTQSPATKALMSRALHYKISFNEQSLAKLLKTAALSKIHYRNTQLAVRVANHITSNASKIDFLSVSLRDLKTGYELAKTHPKEWQALLDDVLPRQAPDDIVRRLHTSGLPVQAQFAEFQAATGRCRRHFYDLRQKLGLRVNEVRKK